MSPGPPRAFSLFRLMLRVVPAPWRDSLERDLNEEAARAGRRGLRRDLWCAWQALRVAARLRNAVPARRAPIDWRRSLMGSLGFDVRFAGRMLRRQAWSAAAIAGTLALGIGATTATYAVFNYVLFRPTPGVADAGRLVTIRFQSAPRSFGSIDRSFLDAARRRVEGLDRLAASYTTSLPMVTRPGADPALGSCEVVTDAYLDVLGVRMRIGRAFSGEEYAAGHDVVMISDALWTREFGGDASALGRAVIVSGHPFTIIGVIDAYRGWGATRVGTVDVWLPIGAERAATGRTDSTFFTMTGRLRSGTTQAMAQAQLTAAYTAFNAETPGRGMPYAPAVQGGLAPMSAGTHDQIMTLYPFLMGGTGLLLLLACANTANLLLARTISRAPDLALRGALGASRWRLVRGLLIESAALAGVAAALGLVIAGLLLQTVRGTQLFNAGGAIDAVPIDWRVVRFAAIVAAATLALFSLVPSLLVSRTDLRRLRDQPGAAARAPRRLRGALVCLQLALSLTLMTGAGVLVRSLEGLRSLDLGLNPEGVVSSTFRTRHVGYKTAQHDAFVRDVLVRLRATAGVDAAAISTPNAFSTNGFMVTVRPQEAPLSRPSEPFQSSVSAEYFQALGIPLVAGRVFTEAEYLRAAGPQTGVVVISQSLATELFGAAPALGRLVNLTGSDTRQNPRDAEVVGVVGDTRSGWDFMQRDRRALYQPESANYVVDTLYVRSRLATADALATIRRVIRELEPNLPLSDVRTLREEIDALFPEPRLLARLTTLVALLATMLGLAGVYAVVVYTVTERTREFGIRLALGATAAGVARHVLGGVGVMCATGVAGGLLIYGASSRWLASRLYGMTALDPLTIGVAVAGLTLAALVAAWLPARRASRIQPTVALRSE